MTPAFRTYFIHPSISGGQQIVTNPAGWKDITLSLERHEEYHTLIEHFKGNFMWYGSAFETLRTIRNSFGPSTVIGVRFEISFEEGVWETLYTGTIRLIQMEELSVGDQEYKIVAPVIRDDFWSKFINQIKKPVDLLSTGAVGGGTVTVVPKTIVKMRSQLLLKQIRADRDSATPFFGATYTGNTTKYFIPALSANQLNDDVGEFFGIEDQVSNNLPTTDRLFFLKLNSRSTGDWVFSNEMRMKITVGAPQLFDTISADIFIVRRKIETGVLDIHTTVFLPYTVLTNVPYDSGWLNFGALQPSFNPTFTDCSAGDEFYFYIRVTSNLEAWGSTNRVHFDVASTNRLYAQTNSSFPDSSTDAFLIKDAADNILRKYTSNNSPLVSTKFSNATFNRNAIFRGKHNRGYDFATKEISMSFDEWWKGADPMFNLCLGYTKVLGEDKIYIEDKAYAFNPTVIVNFPDCRNIVRRFDAERFINSVEIGYQKWSAESSSGIDDPQTKQTRNVQAATFGEDLKILSSFITAGLAIERSRRNKLEFGKDDRLDEDMMLVSVIPDGSNWQLEFAENFASITGILNSSARANLRHTVMRVFKRWRNLFNYDGLLYMFGRGEGNNLAQTRLRPTDYEATTNPDELINERSNYSSTGSPRLWYPYLVEVGNYEMSWETYKLLNENKNNAVGISRGSTGFIPCYLLDLDYSVFKSKANMLLIQRNNEEL